MKRQLPIAVLVAAFLLLFSSCARQQFTPPTTESTATQPADSSSQLPFSGEAGSASVVKKAAAVDSVPVGTPISVRLQTAVSSATARPGQEFDAVLDQPLVINGETIAEPGTHVVGRVVSARRSGRLQNPGYLRLTLISMSVNGKVVPLQTSSIFAKGASHKNRNLAFMGSGAAGGAIIGGIAGGGKGALIGSAVGAAAGTGGAYASGKKEVGFSAEHRLTFRLTQPVIING